MANGRCRMHGGLSTGPRTTEGRERCRRARLSPMAATPPMSARFAPPPAPTAAASAPSSPYCAAAPLGMGCFLQFSILA